MISGLTEAQVQNQIIAYLNVRGILHWRQNTGSFKVDERYIRAGKKGISDIIGCLPDGRFFAVEVKRGTGGRLSQDQKEFIENVINNNGVGLVANDFEKFKKIFDEILDKINSNEA